MEIIILTLAAVMALFWVVYSNLEPPTQNSYSAGKYYYCPDDDTIVYCHQTQGADLILSGHCDFVSDAYTSITRQKISSWDFTKHSPVELKMNKLDTYRFLTNDRLMSEKTFSVHDRKKPYKKQFDNASEYPWQWDKSPMYGMNWWPDFKI